MAAIWVPLIRLEEIMGQAAALALATEYGGLAIYVGKKPSPGLLAACGGDADAAMRLCSEYGGSDILLPSAMVRPVPKKEKICAMVEAGCGNMEIVKEVGCTARYVSECRHNLGRPDRTRPAPKRVEIITMLKKRKRMTDAEIASQTGAAVAYVSSLRSSLRRGLIA